MTNNQTKVTIIYLIEQAKEERMMMLQQANSGDYKGASEYENRFTMILEMIETLDCGSVGGFGKGQPSNNKILIRFLWLTTKYKDLM